MKPQRIGSPIVQGLLVLLCTMWSMAVWCTFLADSFTTSRERPGYSTMVNGMGAGFIGIVLILLALRGNVLPVQSLVLRECVWRW